MKESLKMAVGMVLEVIEIDTVILFARDNGRMTILYWSINEI